MSKSEFSTCSLVLGDGWLQLRTLVVGYNVDHVEKLVDMLLRSNDPQFEITICRTLEATLELLTIDHRFDLVILFLCLPDAPELRAFEEIYPKLIMAPIIMISPTDDDRMAYKALTGGAQDFLVIDEIIQKSLIKSLLYAYVRHTYRTAHREVLELKRQTHKLIVQMDEVRGAHLGIINIVRDLNKRITDGNNKDAPGTCPG